eukprot:SAG31_NODE_1706_length_7491_cov_1.948593_10_plen_149_part_00
MLTCEGGHRIGQPRGDVVLPVAAGRMQCRRHFRSPPSHSLLSPVDGRERLPSRLVRLARLEKKLVVVVRRWFDSSRVRHINFTLFCRIRRIAMRVFSRFCVICRIALIACIPLCPHQRAKIVSLSEGNWQQDKLLQDECFAPLRAESS